MTLTKPMFCSLALFFSGLTLLSSCSKENAYQDDANQQSSLASQQKTQQLQQVQGTYTGKMHLTQGFDLDVVILLQVNQGTASQPDQINKVQVPMLGGNLTFPGLQHEGCLASLGFDSDLSRAMGTSCEISFVNGDFNTNSTTITLPYNSAGSTYSNDQVIGTFSNGVFTGEWDNHSSGTVGTFTLERSDS